MSDNKLIEGELGWESHTPQPSTPEIQRSKFYNYALALTVALGGFHLGYYISIFNPFSDQFLDKSYQITSKSDRDSEIGTINLCFTLGCMVGAILGGYLLQITGRIKSIMLLECISIAVMVAYYFSPDSLWLMYITRVLSGMLVGMFNTVCPTTNAEILPKDVSSFGGVMFYGSITTGILVTSLFGQFIDKDYLADQASYLLVVPGLLSVLRIILFLTVFNFESPVYIIEKYAQRRGHRISETAKVDQSGDELLASLENDSPACLSGDNFSLDAANSARITKTLQRLFAEESVEGVKKGLVEKMDDTFSRKTISFGELFSPYYRKKFFIGIGLNWFQQFNGINFFIMYATGAFNDQQEGTGDTINLIGAVVNWLSFIPTIYFSNKFGRRFNLFSGISIQLFGYLLGIIFT